MAMKSPQEMQVTPLEATPGTRFQSSIAPRIDTGFLDTLSQKVANDEELRIRDAKNNLEFNRADFRNKANSLRIDSQSLISDKQGVNAITDTPKIQADYRKKLETMRDKYPANYQQYIDQDLEQEYNKLSTFAVPYTHSQTQKLRDETHKTDLSNAINFAAENSGDVNSLIGKGLIDVEVASSKLLAMKYGTNPDKIIDESGATAGMLIEAGKKKARSETVLNSINLQSRLGPIGFANAEKIMEKLDDMMTTEDQVKALGYIKTAREKGESKASITLAEDAIRMGAGDLNKVSQYILTNSKTDKEARTSIAFANDHFMAEKKQKARDYENTLTEANQTATASGRIPWDILNNKMDSEQRTKFVQNWNKNGGKVSPAATNYEVYSKVNDYIFSLSPDEAKNFKLAPYLNDLAPEQAEVLQRAVNERMKKGQDDKDRAQNSSLKDVRDITSMFIAQNGLMAEQVGRVKELAYLEAERLKGDKNITIPQIKARLYQAMKKGLFETKEVPGRFWGTNTETVMKETFAPDMSKIHESHKLAFRKQMLASPKYKRLPTPAEEQTQLERLMREGRDLTIPR